MPLNFTAETIEDGAGGEFPAHYASCGCREEGAADMFSVFFPLGLDHAHLQCGNCDQSYCLHGMCHTPIVLPPPA